MPFRECPTTVRRHREISLKGWCLECYPIYGGQDAIICSLLCFVVEAVENGNQTYLNLLCNINLLFLTRMKLLILSHTHR